MDPGGLRGDARTMPSTFHYVQFRTFAHATEDVARVKAALLAVVGADVEVTETAAEGHYKNPIRILATELTNRRQVDAFFKHLAGTPRLLDTVHDQLDLRLDDKGVFYLRFSKQDAYMQRLTLTREEDAILVRGKVAAFPAKRENALKSLDAYLGKWRGAAGTA